MAEQSLCQHDTYLLIVRQFRHHLIVLFLLHAQVLQQLGSIALSVPSVHLGEGHLQFGGQITVLLGHFRLGIEGFAVLHVLPEGLVTLHHGVHHRERIIFEVVLTQDRETLTWSQFYRSLVGFQFTADGFQERRFTRTVGTDDAVDVAIGKLDVDVFVKDAFAKLNGEIRNCYHFVLIPY